MIIIYIIFVSLFLFNKNIGELVEYNVNVINEIEADCAFTIHEKGPEGKLLAGTSLNAELYYKITCQPHKGYCLRVSNCSVSDTISPTIYPIIDDNGCTMEPSLFEHVQYVDDFTAGIYNPLPIRFRSSESTVKFQCSTTLFPINSEGRCIRKLCT